MFTFANRLPRIVVACQPKSGSSFLTGALSALPGMRGVSLVPGHDRREQELCELRLRQERRGGYVAHMHLRHSSVTDDLVKRYGLSVVVLTRDLFDVVVSLRDHLRKESTVFPMAYFTEEHLRLPDAELEAAITKLVIPWYINFYMGWRDCPYAIHVRYEGMIANPNETIASIARAVGLSPTEVEIEHAMSAVKVTRLNSGVAGRGVSLSAGVKRDITDMLAFYSGSELLVENIDLAGVERVCPAFGR